MLWEDGICRHMQGTDAILPPGSFTREARSSLWEGHHRHGVPFVPEIRDITSRDTTIFRPVVTHL